MVCFMIWYIRPLSIGPDNVAVIQGDDGLDNAVYCQILDSINY